MGRGNNNKGHKQKIIIYFMYIPLITIDLTYHTLVTSYLTCHDESVKDQVKDQFMIIRTNFELNYQI
jgi:hypothetical protein